MPLLLALELRNVKITYRKSYPMNLLQVLNLIFDTYFKVQLGHFIEKAFYIPYYCSLIFEPHFMVRLSSFLLNIW